MIAALFIIPSVVIAQGLSVEDHTRTEEIAEKADGVYGYGGSSDEKTYDDSFSADAAIMANSKDWYVGGELFVYSYLNIGLGIQCMYRFDAQTVFEQRDEYRYRQYRETRWVVGFHLHRDFMFTDFGVYVQGGWGVTTGEYQGSADDPDSASGWRLGGGGVFRRGVLRARLGYQYTVIPNFPDNFLVMSFGVLF